MNQKLEQLNHLKQQLEKAKSDIKSESASKKSFFDFRRQQLRNSPSEVSGYQSQLSPISQIEKNFTLGVSKGWVLKNLIPHVHSITMIWQTDELTDEQVEKNIEKKIAEEFKLKTRPFEEAVITAESALTSFKEELQELNDALKVA
ncbi:hypothetical protein [Rosenbergiella metrosideri]|uniref:hypothetical protein n=1 Tax=Rosenbergiella metrosideri TaxID=2921185 RepID=UPI001F4FFF92|nr:hypothetical protein [Rosenbergiella metrosideri]